MINYSIYFQIVIKEIQLNNFGKFSLNYFSKRNTLPRVEEAVTYRRFREEKRRFGKSNGSESRIFSSYVYFDSWSTASCLSGSLSDPENFFIPPSHSNFATQNAKGHAASMTSFTLAEFYIIEFSSLSSGDASWISFLSCSSLSKSAIACLSSWRAKSIHPPPKD